MRVPKALFFLCVLILLLGTAFTPAALYAVTFTGTELLARPTNNAVTVNVVADAALEAYFEYGTTSGALDHTTGTISSTANEPITVVINGLAEDTMYYYKMIYSENGGSTWVEKSEHSFHTQRPSGEMFSFTITSDSHVNIALGYDNVWQQTLSNVADDHPDFHLDLGDTFAMDNVTTEAGARNAYLYQRASNRMGRISHSAPIFIVPGNHEEEEGWHLDDTGNPETSKPVLGTNARKRYFPNPVPDGFYTGNTDTYYAIDGDGLHEDYYAWTWGDALFVVIDPYWYSTTKPFTGNTGGGESSDYGSGDRWDWTLGQNQYVWLKQTLEENKAKKFKFMFAHHMTGGTDDYIRGGAYAVPYCEWGGYDENGTSFGFDERRPLWEKTIHQLMKDNKVSAFFHGHDHQYAYEKRDGIVYQSLPSAGFTGSGFGIYNDNNQYTIKDLPSSGHLRVTVSPSQTTVDYVRSGGTGGSYSYTIDPFVTLCQGDFDASGDVSEADLAVFAGDFGNGNCAGGCNGDFNEADNDVDGWDLSVFADEFGRMDCPF